MNEAGRARAEADDLTGVLAEIFHVTGGALSDQEVELARRTLAETDRR